MRSIEEIMAAPESDLSNAEIMRKATITVSDIATNGKLNDKQSDKFVDFVFDLSSLKDKVRQVRFRNDKLKIDKIGVHRRLAVPSAEGVDPGIRRGITTSGVLLEPKNIMVPFDIGSDFIRENLEGMSIEEHIIRMMAAQFANDLEELFITGDTLQQLILAADALEGGATDKYFRDNFLGLSNGWIKLARAGAYIVDALDSDNLEDIFHDMKLKMPLKFRRRLDQLKYICASDTEQYYRYALKHRATSLGDAAVGGTDNVRPWGIELQPFPLWPANPAVTEEVTLSGTDPINLDYKPIVSNSEVVALATDTEVIGGTPFSPQTAGASALYTMNYTNGTITPGATASDTDTIITYLVGAMIMLTYFNNMVMGVGLDVELEKDRNIHKNVNEFVLRGKAAVCFEELEAVVLAVNVKNGKYTPS